MIVVVCGRKETGGALAGSELAGAPLFAHIQNAFAGASRTRFVSDEGAFKAWSAEAAGKALPEDLLLIRSDVWMSAESADAFVGAASSRSSAVQLVGERDDLLSIFVPAGANIGADLLQLCERDPAGAAKQLGAGRMTVAELGLDFPPLRVDSFAAIANAERAILRSRADDAMRKGVRLRDPATVHIRGELECGTGVEIDANVIVEGKVKLGDGVRIGANCLLVESTVGAGTRINPYSIVDHAQVGSKSFVGPYGRLRPGAVIGDAVQVGNFVEIKNSQVGAGSRINHLAFIGDAALGANVTIGAGTITCNHGKGGVARTEIAEDAYIGSGTELVAPVVIGAASVIGAGSTITSDVPAGMLVVARAEQKTVGKARRRGEKPSSGQ